MDNPSTIERLHSSGSRASEALTSIHENARRREADAPGRNIERIARALPDALFKDRPEIMKATSAVEEMQKRIARLRSMPARSLVADAVQTLEAESLASAAELREATVDDVLEGAYDFPRTVAAMKRAEHVECQLKAARLAMSVTARSLPHLAGELSERAAVAKNTLSDLLIKLKRAYLNEHPELLQGDPDKT